ncbi:hypothetical protein HNY73_018603 [Argiope bruennichi]|uniref:Uncharacterized protein n=1 Tax=Argiope bruennichi TaxID=94029 RepID=A0A8T0EE43_ARGBR|nr:hypothetical protein HNY73_018603 [Argiope bruennichi]
MIHLFCSSNRVTLSIKSGGRLSVITYWGKDLLRFVLSAGFHVGAVKVNAHCLHDEPSLPKSSGKFQMASGWMWREGARNMQNGPPPTSTLLSLEWQDTSLGQSTNGLDHE